MDANTKQCVGCYRTIEEISYWATMGTHAREQVMRQIEMRRREAKTR